MNIHLFALSLIYFCFSIEIKTIWLVIGETKKLVKISVRSLILSMFFIKTVDSNISEHLYEEENDIDEVSTPITTPSSESGHTYGIIRPEILATPSFTFNVTSSSDVIFLKYRFIYTHFLHFYHFTIVFFRKWKV